MAVGMYRQQVISYRPSKWSLEISNMGMKLYDLVAASSLTDAQSLSDRVDPLGY